MGKGIAKVVKAFRNGKVRVDVTWLDAGDIVNLFPKHGGPSFGAAKIGALSRDHKTITFTKECPTLFLGGELLVV